MKKTDEQYEALAERMMADQRKKVLQNQITHLQGLAEQVAKDYGNSYQKRRVVDFLRKIDELKDELQELEELFPTKVPRPVSLP